jgi:hypothetical protein
MAKSGFEYNEAANTVSIAIPCGGTGIVGDVTDGATAAGTGAVDDLVVVCFRAGDFFATGVGCLAADAAFFLGSISLATLRRIAETSAFFLDLAGGRAGDDLGSAFAVVAAAAAAAPLSLNMALRASNLALSSLANPSLTLARMASSLAALEVGSSSSLEELRDFRFLGVAAMVQSAMNHEVSKIKWSLR